MTANPAPKVFCLSDVNHFAFLIMEIIDPRSIGNCGDLFRRQVWRQVLFPTFAMKHMANRSLRIRAQYFFEKDNSGVRITPSPVPVENGYIEFPAKLTQTVSGKSRKDFPAEPNGAKFIGIQFISTGFQLIFDKRIIKINVMSHEYGVLQHLINPGSHLRKHGCVYQHVGTDSRQHLYVLRDGCEWVDQCFKSLCDLISIMKHNS